MKHEAAELYEFAVTEDIQLGAPVEVDAEW